MEIATGTSFFQIYCRFLDKVTDDMFLELTLEETLKIINSLFKDALHHFTYPRFRVNHYDEAAEILERIDEEEELITYGAFFDTLTNEEEDIIAEIMLLNWYQRQLSNTRIIQMRYSTSDFKQTSQAAHMQRLGAISETQRVRIRRMLNNYSKRTVTDDGYVVPRVGELAGVGHIRRNRVILTQLGVVKR